jgi:mono/diheme cytochrome c family protein
MLRVLRMLGVLAALFWHPALADDGPTPLKPGPGADPASTNCGVCHSSDYIVMNSLFLTPDGWKAEVTKMRSAFGAPIDDATAAQIIAYLAAHYAVTPKP